MKIDKTRFLVLTGMLSAAAVACTVQNTKKDEPSNNAPANTNGGGGSETSDAGGGSVLDSSSTNDAASNADADAAIACIGDDGAAPDCTASKCPTECETVAARFKKGIARAIVGCLEISPTCESITSCITEKAEPSPDAGAAAAICDDATAATFCQPLVDSCKENADNGGAEITQQTCVAMAKTLSADGRDQFTSCITEGMEGYCTYGSSWCLDAMRY